METILKPDYNLEFDAIRVCQHNIVLRGLSRNFQRGGGGGGEDSGCVNFISEKI